MLHYQLPYGHRSLTLTLPEGLHVEMIAPRSAEPAADPLLAVARALDQPVGGVSLAQFGGARSVAIAVNDKTRPVPHQVLLPPLLERMVGLGIPPAAITFFIATGTHRPMSPAEYPAILPAEVLAHHPVLCHDAGDTQSLVHVGQTERGTPVWINRHFLEADLRCVVGNLEPHQIVGFSGGVKSAVIGLAGKATISHNHALMAEEGAQLGKFHGNPARQDLEEMGRITGIHLALNAILNSAKQIVHVVAGEPRAVMEAGIPRVREVYQVPVEHPFDLLIASPGGHPKDINIYQAQKALGHAALVSRPGGTIIMAAACPEGSGSAAYEDWVSGMNSHEAVIERFRQEGFAIGPHKAFQIARDSAGRRVLWVSDLKPSLARRLLLEITPGLEQATAVALRGLPSGARVGVLPMANATIPLLASEADERNEFAAPGGP